MKYGTYQFRINISGGKMKKKSVFMFLIISISLLYLVSCAITNQSSIQAGRIGFTKEMDEPSARGQLKRITPEQSDARYRFCISPDEKDIVFSGVQAGGGDNLLQLWKISSNGSGSPIKITSGGTNHFLSPSYTSDGEYIVYTSEGKLWKVREDGAGGKMKIPGSGTGWDFAPHVSCDNILVFCSVQYSNNNTTKKYLMWTSNLNGGELTQIREGYYPRWSPDGNYIVFQHDNEIWTINADGTQLTQLTNTSKIREELPSFSYDGNYIVYTSNEGKDGNVTSDWNIWTMKSDGSEKSQITELGSWDSWPIWSKDGIYFLSARAQKNNERIQRIWKLNTK